MKEIINITKNNVNPAFAEANAIVFSFDDNYAKYFSVALQSLIENSDANERYDIVVFEDGISEFIKFKMLLQLPENFSLRFFDIKKYLLENYSGIVLKKKYYWSLATYYRLFIPFIMRDYNRVLYLDTDIIVNQNIDSLFDIDSEDKELIVSQDTISQLKDEYIAKEQVDFIQTVLKLNVDSYFNTGMIVFLIKNISLSHYEKDLLNAFFIKNLQFPDQDILNKIFYKKVKFLPFFNLQIFGPNYNDNLFIKKVKQNYKEEILSVMKNAKVIHFITSMKPWHVPSNTLADRFWYYARKTPFYEEIIYTNMNYSNEKQLTRLEKWFSITNGYYHGKKYKVLSILGCRIKLY